MGAVKNQLDMQAVIAQHHRIGRLGVATVAHKLARLHQRHIIHQQLPAFYVIAPRICVADTIGGEGFIQKHPRARHHPGAAALVIATGLGQAAHDIGAIKHVIQAAPARVGRVQRKAGVGDGHHQLRAGHLGDFRIDILRAHLKGRPFGHQIANLGQKRAIGFWVGHSATIGHMPGVDLFLNGCAFIQQRLVFRSKIMGQYRKPCPKRIGCHAGARQRFFFDEICQFGGH